MKKILLFGVIILHFGFNSIKGQTDPTKKSPFTFETSYIGDVFYNFSGGLKKGGTYLGMVNLKIGFNIEDAGWWKGGEIFVHAANTHGGEPSATHIGDFQVASNIEAGNLSYLHELWIKQSIGKATLVLGLQDLCAEFVSSEYAGLFLNSSCGVHSTIATNLAVPIFPLTAIGGQFHFDFNDNFSLKIAGFDGVPDDFSFNPYNLKWNLKKEEGYLLFSQVSFQNLTENKPGSYKLGFYYHNEYTLKNQDDMGSIQTEKHPANYGLYLILDQTIFQKQNGRSLSFFFQSSISPKGINENWYFMGGGINYKGFISKRMDDVFGFAISHAGINNHIGNETTLEVTYKALLSEHFYLQPDFQYIINPAGTEQKLKNACAGFIRFGLQF